MCGVVGLMIKDEKTRAKLGAWMLPMFDCMAERGPDSAGLAVFGEASGGKKRRFNLFSLSHDFDWSAFKAAFQKSAKADARIEPLDNHAVLHTALAPEAFRAWLKEHAPDLLLLSVGQTMDVYKDQGNPSEIARRYEFEKLKGSHGVGHTRMATESAVSPAHAHPFTAGEDFCLVHNGSLSNPCMLRRKLEAEGLEFETDNDSEAACRFIEWRLRKGDQIDAALHAAFRDLDGFYTLLIATQDRLTLVRDAFACKPAVVAECDGYVAVASEFRSLAHLPGIAQAKIFEPRPEEVYTWKM